MKAALAIVAVACAMADAGAQTPQAKPPKPTTAPPINSQMGEAYPIDELENTLTYTLESVALASRFASATSNIVAPADRRLLILTSRVTNPQTHLYPLGGDLVVFNVFTENAERFLSTTDSFILPGMTSFPTNLRPKETLRFVSVVAIHGAGPISRMAAVKGERRTRRAWYDVQQHLTPVTSVFASGTDLRDRAETTIGKTFDLGAFDMAVESAGPVASVGTYQTSSSSQVYAVTLRVTNALSAPEKFGWQYAKPALVDATGKELSWNSDLVDSATGKTVIAELPAGQAYILQYAFTAERGRALKTFTLAMNGGRTISVDLTHR